MKFVPDPPPSGTDRIGNRKVPPKRPDIIPPTGFMMIEDGVSLIFGQLKAPLTQMPDRPPRMPAAGIDFTHIVQKSRQSYTLGRLEPGNQPHDPINLQRMLHKSPFFRMMVAGGSRVEIRGVQMADDRLDPGSPGGPQDPVEFFFVGHNLLVCLLLLRLRRPAAEQG